MSSSSSSSSSDSETDSKDNAVSKGLKRKRHADDSNKNDEEKFEDHTTTGSTSESDSDSDSDSDASKEEIKQSETKSENVLSHAAQRKLKKKAQKAAQGHDDICAKQEATKKLTETNPKRQNSIWVGNLAFKTTEQAIREFFTRHVPGCEITRVNMPKKGGQDVKDGTGMRGQNKGFAYVDFSTEEAKTKAIETSEQNLDGRKLLIKDGHNFEGRPAGPPIDGDNTKSKTAKKILASQKQPPGPTLFFGNLSFQVTETSLQALLERNWKFHGIEKNDAKDDQNQNEKPLIRKVRLGTFEDSGKCKGWAFVDFHNPEDATHTLINPKNHFLDGRKLVVEYASQEAVRRGGGAPRIQDKPNRKRHTKDSGQDKSENQGHGQQDVDMDVDEKPVQKKRKIESTTRQKRTKPGAALAMAKRETAAIVPSTGKKIVF